MKNLELKIYEKLGVRKFRNILVKIIYFTLIPFLILFKIPKEDWKNIYQEYQVNYFMKKGNGLQDLKDYLKWPRINGTLHLIAFIPCIRGLLLGTFIIEIPLIILNTYCIMLQRYNYVRINNAIKKFEEIEKKKISNMKEQIKDNIEDSQISVYNYKKKKKEKNKTIDDMLDNLSLKSLKELKKEIETKQIYNYFL